MGDNMKVNRKLFTVSVSCVCLIMGLIFNSCTTTQQYGLESGDTIALNLTKDPNVGDLYVTHVNGIATGGAHGKVYVNPIYIKLDGKPIIFTLQAPVVSTNIFGKQSVSYKTTELRLTQISNLKAGDVLTLRWMYQTQTFAFLDSTGNIVQQTIPTFN